MDTAAVIFESIRAVLYCILFLFVPGFFLSLVIFPRSNSLRVFDRLVYSIILGVSSGIAAVVFMDMVLRFDRTLENLVLVISVFCGLLLLFWLGEQWYLNRPGKKRGEPPVPEGDRDLRLTASRATNAAKDRFRQDTRTRVIYHESVQSGTNHCDHNYLLDSGEEIPVQQVAENKLDLAGNFVVKPPYEETRYFELVIHEYHEEGVSLVDDLQISPVLVTASPGTSGSVLKQDTLQIKERLNRKTTSTEIHWIYSHGFHIYAILHEEDTLDQMVDRVSGKLDEIVLAVKKGIRISAPGEDREILKDAFETVMEKPRGMPAQPQEIPKIQETRPGIQAQETRQRPLVLPDVREEKAGGRAADPGRAGPEKAPEPLVPHPGRRYEEIPPRPDVQPRTVSTESQKHEETTIVIESIRKLQKEILRDQGMFYVLPESLKKPKKNIEQVRIPKKADINKKLAEAKEELKDLDWLYE